MRNLFVRGLLALSFLLAASQARPAPAEGTVGKKGAAVAAAKAWLALVDEGRYAESWDSAAELFQGAVPKGQWVQQLGGARAPLGKVLARTLASAAYRTSVPGAPDGEYVVIQFETSFSNKKAAVETVTPMLERNGSWRVSGYFVR